MTTFRWVQLSEFSYTYKMNHHDREPAFFTITPPVLVATLVPCTTILVMKVVLVQKKKKKKNCTLINSGFTMGSDSVSVRFCYIGKILPSSRQTRGDPTCGSFTYF